MSSVDHSARLAPSDWVGGLLAAFSVVLSGIAMGLGFVLGVDGYPARTIPVALILAVLAGRMSGRFESMARKAVIFASIAWVVGMTVAVLTEAPLL